MTYCSFFNLSIISNCHNKKYVQFGLMSFSTFKGGFVKKTREIFNCLPLVKSSVAFAFNFLLQIIS